MLCWSSCRVRLCAPASFQAGWVELGFRRTVARASRPPATKLVTVQLARPVIRHAAEAQAQVQSAGAGQVADALLCVRHEAATAGPKRI